MRIIFKSKSIRDVFFKQVLASYNYEFWSDLYRKLRIRRSLFEKYRSGKLTISSDFYSILSRNFDHKLTVYFSKKIKLIDSNWGNILGGSITYKKYPRFFKEGRKKGLSKILKKYPIFDINIPLDSNLSYFLGLFIGDGFSNKYGRYYLTQFVGHASEYDYYNRIICPYMSHTFNAEPTIIKSKEGNFIRVNTYSKDLFLMLTKRFKISPGRKSRNVLIPSLIESSQSDVLLSCIAGIYDAECCVFWDKRKNYSEPYPRIDLHMNNPNLLRQINLILKEHSINSTLSKNIDRILIYGKNNIGDFLSKIQLRNPKHLLKLESIHRKTL
ncbi:hypothetical protein KW805_02455 [Candidatus Pacearchaeota archaeon]|nr:hypothetical protein [Candidatus Pacearchaeota archaeon]